MLQARGELEGYAALASSGGRRGGEAEGWEYSYRVGSACGVGRAFEATWPRGLWGREGLRAGPRCRLQGRPQGR